MRKNCHRRRLTKEGRKEEEERRKKRMDIRKDEGIEWPSPFGQMLAKANGGHDRLAQFAPHPSFFSLLHSLLRASRMSG
jgi:hypothetical protein